MDFGVVLQTDPPARRGDRAGPAVGVARLRLRVDLRLARALAGAVRHLLADPRQTQVGDGGADGDQPAVARLGGHRVAVRHPQRDVRQPHRLRDRPRRLGGAGCSGGVPPAWPPSAGPWPSSRTWPRAARPRSATTRSRSPGCATAAWRCSWPPTGRAPSSSPASRPTGSSSSSPTRSSWGGPSAWPAPGRRGSRARPGGVQGLRGRPRLRRRRPAPTSGTSCAGSAGMVGNHVADIVERYGADARERARGADVLHRRAQGLRLLPPRQARATRRRSSCPTRSSTASASSAPSPPTWSA